MVGRTIPEGDVTRMLRQWREGDGPAFDTAFEALYEDMHRSARSYLRNAPNGGTLQPTALIHEAFLRLSASKLPPQIKDRHHFLALAAQVMRRVLVDRARERLAVKRGGGDYPVEADARIAAASTDPDRLLLVDAALTKLFEVEPALAEVVVLRYYAGYEIQEAAGILEVSTATLSRRQRAAEAWLARAIQPE